MTREEADFIGGMNMCDEISNEAYKKIMCHCEEQEPCEDAVSRQAVIDTIYHECSGENLDIDFAKVLLLQRKIKTLQSVNPQKLGHWKERRNRATGHIETVCSECGAEEGYPYNDYCGNCGAKMVEPQESEG